uniref:Uncharacterized protein n=1 Tax=Trichogramma kaykai TaxID=54128 RepID=A0ABD2XNU9_9HYME
MKRESRASSNISEDCIEGDDEQEGKATYPKSCNRCRQEEGRTAHDHKDISPNCPDVRLSRQGRDAMYSNARVRPPARSVLYGSRTDA